MILSNGQNFNVKEDEDIIRKDCIYMIIPRRLMGWKKFSTWHDYVDQNFSSGFLNVKGLKHLTFHTLKS